MPRLVRPTGKRRGREARNLRSSETNLRTTYIGDNRRPPVRLPNSLPSAVLQADRHGDDHDRAAVKDCLADVEAARIAFLENAVNNAPRRSLRFPLILKSRI
jgi:hypothetical protein